jgi:hypothetical protein
VRAALALLAAIAALTAPATAAEAGPPRPLDLTVVGGEGWRVERSFALVWTNPAAAEPLAAVRYRVRDPRSETVESTRLNSVVRSHTVKVPSTPGAYTVSVWLEDRDGRQGPVAEAKLRFDDGRPASVLPRPPARWIGRSEFPLTVPLEPGAGPAPVSGVRGHAYSVGSAGSAPPCSPSGRCTKAEAVDGGDDELVVARAPEGVNRLRVVAVSGAGLASPNAGEATLRVDTTDPVTRLSGLPRGWTRRAVRLTARATDPGSGMTGGRAYTAIRVGGDPPVSRPGSTVETTVIAEGSHRVAYYASDAAGNADDGGGANGHANHRPRTATARIDRTPPRAGFLPQDPADPELLRVRIRDRLSGPDPGRGWIGVRPAGSAGRFLPLPAARPGGEELRARWDSAAHPLGLYEFRARAFDAAGNLVTTTLREGGAPMILANPLKTTTELRSGFGGRTMRWQRCRQLGERRRCRLQTVADFSRRPARRTVPYGRGLPLSGRLVAGIGRPPGPRPVKVVERFALGARQATRATTVWTEPGGEFTTRLRPGPTREVTVSYGGSRVLAASTGSALRLGVRSGVRLQASTRAARIGGAPLVLRGRVRAEPGEIPAEGCSVQLQFRLAGLPWEEFRTVRTNRRGGFRLAYRFSDDDSRGARFQFRAHVPAQGEWPYEPGSSRPLAVRGE